MNTADLPRPISGPHYAWWDAPAMAVVIAGTLALVWLTLRMLLLDPAPALGRLSLRRQARHLLRPHSRRARLLLGWHDFRRHRFKLRFPLYLGLLAALWLPWALPWGPLDSEAQSGEYLRTLWQVVAAALGVSVAMVAFAFEAFSTSGQRSYGGSLREFAHESGLVIAIELGLFSLFIDGVVLFGPLDLETAGWPAFAAMVLSAITLLGVVGVVHQILRLLDERALNRMRRRRVRYLIDAAMRQQLIGQAADLWLATSRLPIDRARLAPAGEPPWLTTREGEVADVKLGRLARWAVRQVPLGSQQKPLILARTLAEEVADNTALIYAAASDRVGRRLARAVRVRARDDERADRALSDLLGTMHQQAMDAVRHGRENEWREIADAYEQVLLGLPRAAAAWGVPFAGAVVAPGFFGQGPVQRIRDFLYEELVAAVDTNSRELIDPITYFPQHIAVQATALGAPAVARPMLALYPAMYFLAKRGRR